MAEVNLEYNTFANGLVTEVSEVNAPESTLRAVQNFELQENGSAFLRPALQYEVNTPVLFSVASATHSSPCSAYVWHNPDGDASVDLVFVQYGNLFKIFRRPVGIGSAFTDITPATATHALDGTIKGSATFAPLDAAGTPERLEFSSAKKWCVVTGLKFVIGSTTHQSMVGIFEYNKTNGTLAAYFDFLWVRDFWGIADGRTNGARTSKGLMTPEIAYNLGNQGWFNAVTGQAPGKYVLQAFHDTSGLDNQNISPPPNQAIPNGGGPVTLQGDFVVDGIVHVEDAPRYIIVDVDDFTELGVHTATIHGVTSDGQEVFEVLTLVAQASVTSVEMYSVVYDIQVNLGIDRLQVYLGKVYPGDMDNWTLGAINEGDHKIFRGKYVAQSPDLAGNSPAGHFIIPAHTRSYTVASQTLTRYPLFPIYNSIFGDGLAALPGDNSGRPNLCAAFAGRMFYASTRSGTTNESVHARSPDIGSYVFFSRVLRRRNEIGACYQASDPTSPDVSDILDDDGGYVYIPELGAVQALTAAGPLLLVIADNGVWQISGDLDSGFKATSYNRTKVSGQGTTAPSSVIRSGPNTLFMGPSGVQIVGVGQQGPQQVSPSDDRIRKHLKASIRDFTNVQGALDYTKHKARFLYKNAEGNLASEFVLNLKTGAFEQHKYLLGSAEIKAVLQFQDDFVYKFSGTDITAPTFLYLVKDGTNLKTAQLRYDDESGELFAWADVGGAYGNDSYATIAHITGGSAGKRKSSQCLIVHLARTESSIIVEPDYDVRLVHPSSCFSDCFWNWGDSETSPYKTQKVQVYRYPRQFVAPEAPGTYPMDYGQSVLTNKLMLRGHGTAISPRFTAENNKDCRILGWSLPLWVEKDE